MRARVARSSGESRALRDESARPSASRTVGTTRSSTSSARSRISRPDHLDLLCVLLPEVHARRPDDREQLEHDGRHAAEVARARAPLEDRAELGRRRPRSGSPAGTSRRPTARTRGRPRHSARACEVAILVARIAREVGVVAELRRVDEEAHDDRLVLRASRAQERQVAVVERAHRRHEPDRAGALRRELFAGLGDRPDDLSRRHLGRVTVRRCVRSPPRARRRAPRARVARRGSLRGGARPSPSRRARSGPSARSPSR